MATRLRADVSIDQGALVPCKWCGQRTRPHAACEACGSPLDLRLRPDMVQAFSDDLLEQETFLRASRRRVRVEPDAPAPVPAATREPDRRRDVVVALRPVISVVEPLPVVVPDVTIEMPRVVPAALRSIESDSAWGVPPTPAVRARIRKENATMWGARIGGFFGLVVLLDFLLSHV